MIEYELVKKRTNKITLQVTQDCTVQITAPSHMPKITIDQYYKTHEAWINQKLETCQKRQGEVSKHTYTSGDSFYLLGETITLSMHLGEKNLIEYDPNTKALIVYHTAEAANFGQTIVLGFYKQFANDYIVKRATKLAKIIGVAPNKIMAKEQKKRWGTCNSKGNVYFNWRLIKAPKDVVDYVIIHELCHLIHLNHSKPYWQLVQKHCPDYKIHRAYLKEKGHIYFDN